MAKAFVTPSRERTAPSHVQSSEFSDLPFRFLDLPPELRELVYTYALPTQAVTYRVGKTIKNDPPPLSRVSRQIRSESMPLYFKLTNFCFVFRRAAADQLVPTVRQWAARYAGSFLQDLRCITFTRRFSGLMWYDCIFRVSPEGQILTVEVEGHGILTAFRCSATTKYYQNVEEIDAKTKLLARHVEGPRTVAGCETEGKGGEILVKAITCEPEIWRLPE